MQNDKIHIGQLVKSVFDNSGLSVSELARRLHCERTNVYTIFCRSTIDVELLARLSKALNHNFFDDAMKLYGIPTAPRIQLNISIPTEDFLSKEIEHLLISLSKYHANSNNFSQ